MSIDSSSDFSGFVQFAAAHLQAGTELTPEQAVEQWRAMHPSEDEAADLEAAIQESLDDMEAGEIGIPFEEFKREFRLRNGLTS